MNIQSENCVSLMKSLFVNNPVNTDAHLQEEHVKLLQMLQRIPDDRIGAI
jgi:hypothetical protein